MSTLFFVLILLSILVICILLPLFLQYKDRNKTNPYTDPSNPFITERFTEETPECLDKRMTKQKITFSVSVILIIVGICFFMFPVYLDFLASDSGDSQGVGWAIILCWPICIAFLVPGTLLLISSTRTLSFLIPGTFLPVSSTNTLKEQKKIRNQTDDKKEELAPKSSMSSSTITPSLRAIIAGNLDLVRSALTDHPEHLNTAYAQNGNTPLHVAALNGYTDIVRLLLEQPGIDTARTNNESKTALDLAREKGFAEIVQMLEK